MEIGEKLQGNHNLRYETLLRDMIGVHVTYTYVGAPHNKEDSYDL